MLEPLEVFDAKADGLASRKTVAVRQLGRVG